jgi:hypothetical protein
MEEPLSDEELDELDELDGLLATASPAPWIALGVLRLLGRIRGWGSR